MEYTYLPSVRSSHFATFYTPREEYKYQFPIVSESYYPCNICKFVKTPQLSRHLACDLLIYTETPTKAFIA